MVYTYDMISERDNRSIAEHDNDEESKILHFEEEYLLSESEEYKSKSEELKSEQPQEKSADGKEDKELTEDQIMKGKNEHQTGRIIRTILYVLIVMLALLVSTLKADLWGFVTFFPVVFLSFTRVSYANMKRFNLFVGIIIIAQYAFALASLNSENSPQKIPEPFNNLDHERPINVPWHQDWGNPIYKYENGHKVKTKWIYYLGLMTENSRVEGLLFDWIIILLINYYFCYFYSVTYELSLNVKIKVDNPDDNDSLELNQDMDSVVNKDIIKRFYFTQNIIYALVLISQIFTVTLLLVVSLQNRGLITIVYLFFCLYYISK